MAVYTDVSDDDLRAFAALYDIGEVLSCKGIAEGVENSNFLVTTERGNFILTLYEKRVAPRDLPFFIALMEHLAQSGLACPTPVHGRDGAALRELCGRPAAMVTFLSGMWPRRIQPFHCAAVGRDPATVERSAGVENNSGVRRGEGIDGLIANAEGLAALGVTLLTVGCNGPDYDLTAAEALCRWRDKR